LQKIRFFSLFLKLWLTPIEILPPLHIQQHIHIQQHMHIQQHTTYVCKASVLYVQTSRLFHAEHMHEEENIFVIIMN
jgi:hypothetical protein